MSYTKEQLRESPLDEKCLWFERVYERVTRELEVVSGKLAGEVGSSELTDIEAHLDDLEDDLWEMEAKFYNGIDVSVLKEYSQEIAQLKIQYTESIDLMKLYKLIQQDPENPEGYFYLGDYNGKRNEPDGYGEDFTKIEFYVPTLQTILSRLTPDKLRLIRKMKEEGLEPQLQLTPIAYTLKTLGRKIDSIRTHLNTGNTFIWRDFNEEELKYSPTSVKASSDKTHIQISGEMTRTAWIDVNDGFLVDIVAMKTELEPDLEIQIDADSKQINFNAVQAEKYFEKMTRQGYSPMSYFSYLLAQMSAIQKGKPLDPKNYSVLLASSLTDLESLANGFWVSGYVKLHGNSTKNQYAGLRVRPSVRLFY